MLPHAAHEPHEGTGVALTIVLQAGTAAEARERHDQLYAIAIPGQTRLFAFDLRDECQRGLCHDEIVTFVPCRLLQRADKPMSR